MLLLILIRLMVIQCIRSRFHQPTGSFLYDGLTQIWSEVQSGVAEYSRHLSSLGINFNYSNYVTDYASGDIYYQDPNNFTDDGYLIKREIQTRHIRNDGNEFTVAELFLDMDTGNGQINGLAPNPQITMYFSRDNGKTWNQGVSKTMGAIGQYLTRVFWRRPARGRDVVFKFVVTDSVPFYVTSGSAVIVEGTPN